MNKLQLNPASIGVTAGTFLAIICGLYSSLHKEVPEFAIWVSLGLAFVLALAGQFLDAPVEKKPPSTESTH